MSEDVKLLIRINNNIRGKPYMSNEWYRYETKVTELAEFLVQSEEIKSVDELLDYYKHPDRYTDVWNIYEKEILGNEPVYIGLLKKESSHRPKQIPVIVSSIESCACPNK